MKPAPETRAVNRRNPLRVDAARLRPPDARVRPLAPPALMSTLDGRTVPVSLKAARIPGPLSRDAGDYLCNYTLFSGRWMPPAAGRARRSQSSCMCAAPLARQPEARPDWAKRPDMAALIRGAAIVIRQAIVASRRKPR